MGLKELFQRWGAGGDRRAIAKAEAESLMSPAERDADQEDYEARRDDAFIKQDFASAEALDVADPKLDE